MEDIDVCRSSNTHNNMICLSCHGPNDLTLGYVSRESSLIIGQLELIKLFYLYNRIENVIINTLSPIVLCKMVPKFPSIPVRFFKSRKPYFRKTIWNTIYMVFVRNRVNSLFDFSNSPVLFSVYYDFIFPVEFMI